VVQELQVQQVRKAPCARCPRLTLGALWHRSTCPARSWVPAEPLHVCLACMPKSERGRGRVQRTKPVLNLRPSLARACHLLVLVVVVVVGTPKSCTYIEARALTNTHIRTRTHTQVHIHTHKYTRTHTCKHTHARAHAHTRARTRKHTDTHIHSHTGARGWRDPCRPDARRP